MRQTGQSNTADSATDGHVHLFIGGLHRSGTTLVARLLSEHPDASGLTGTGVSEDEGQHLQSVFPTAERHGGPGRFGFSSQMHMTERSPLIVATTRARLLDAWLPYWDDRRRVLIEKSPPNLLKMRFLQAVFPDARFVMVVRHPIVTAVATQKWSGTRLGELLRHWFKCYETMLVDAADIRQLTIVRYEDLVRDCSSEVERLQDFSGLSRVALDFTPDRELNSKYVKAWERARRTRPQLAVLARRLEHRANRFGYSLLTPRAPVEPVSLVGR